MANKNWDPDDLLNFHYDNAVPEKKEDQNDDFKVFDELKMSDEPAKPVEKKVRRGLDDSFDSYEELKRYEEQKNKSSDRSAGSVGVRSQGTIPNDQPRHARAEAPVTAASAPSQSKHARTEAPVTAASAPSQSKHARTEAPVTAASAPSQSKKSNFDFTIQEPLSDYFGQPGDRGLVVEEDEPGLFGADFHADKEIAAIKQASQDAIDRYRSNYTKNKRKKEGKSKVTALDRIITLIYIIALAAFVASMLIMNVLPFGYFVAMCVVLGLLSLVIFVQTRRKGIRKWGKVLATLLAVVLIGVYGVGTVYALNTLSFLSTTSVDNPDAVGSVTKDPFNIVITGIDVKGKIGKEGRSDVNMILTVNPKTGRLLMTSIPRDYEIYLRDKDNAVDKLTHTGFYGVDTTMNAEEDLLDITANYYVKVNFSTVEKFIDAIGGVDVYSEYEFEPVKLKGWTVKEGMNHMNGKQALAFARERKAFLTGDNQRIKNQQAVFEAMFKKATSSRTMILNYSKILSNLQDYFEMSFSSREVRALVRMQLAKQPDWKIYKNTIVGGDGSLPTYSTGGAYCYVMTQDETSISYAKELINGILEGKKLKKDKENEGKYKVVEDKSEDSDKDKDKEE